MRQRAAPLGSAAGAAGKLLLLVLAGDLPAHCGVDLPAAYDRCVSFFFQAEDGIRDLTVTGVQTCALPICARARRSCRSIATTSSPRSSRRRGRASTSASPWGTRRRPAG